MRTLLRRVSSGLYFQSADHWTADTENAHDFRSIDRALEFIRTGELRGVELAFTFRNSDHVRAVSIHDMSLRYSDE
jgi:hypothetical protein